MKTKKLLTMLAVAALASGIVFNAAPAGAQEKGNEHPWNLSVSVGRMDFEGDFPAADGFIAGVRLGYDYSEWWSFEGGLQLCPYLTGSTYIDYDNEKGKGYGAEINRLEDEAGVSSTWAMGLTLDALFHPTPWKRVDPYLSVGVAGMMFGDSFRDNDQWDGALRGGGGVIYNINDEWSVRADFRGAFASVSDKGTVNSTIDVGVRYVFGAYVQPGYTVSGGVKDSDADGLTDDEERRIGTDPYRADTDNDGLSDYDEVKVWTTDPLNPDTDYDGLKDGVEVFIYKTEPKNPDTDAGGVYDGHEVREDGTNPKDRSDDLVLFTLNIQFDYDKAIIKPEYFNDFEKLGKTLQRDPGATARIEGHADKLKGSSKEHNDLLSDRRAKASLDFLADKYGIEKNRMVAVGYGFSRPKAKNDLISGNPVNRRVEVYIRKSGMPPAPAATIQPVELPPATGPAGKAGTVPEATPPAPVE